MYIFEKCFQNVLDKLLRRVFKPACSIDLAFIMHPNQEVLILIGSTGFSNNKSSFQSVTAMTLS